MNDLELIKEKWQEITEYIKNEFSLTDTSYKTWILSLKPVAIINDTLYILYPGSEGEKILDYINKKYHSQILFSIGVITGISFERVKLVIVDAENIPNGKTEDEKVITHQFPSIAPATYQDFDQRYTFDNFVVGINNEFAHAASLSVAESPGMVYNPLFIYGGPGLGKTHLMNAIAHFVRDNYPQKNILSISSEKFSNEYVNAILNSKNNKANINSFRNKFRNLDLLLVDDIQFLETREGSINEFFHTYEALKSANKQIVITSDKTPKELKNIDDRLISRFESGLLASITSPDFETRMAILRKKEEIEHISIDNEVLNYIATNIKTNIRELEGALLKIIAYSKLYQKSIDLKTAEECLKDIISPSQAQVITPELITSVVSEHYGVPKEQILGEKRLKEIVLPRQIVMYLSKELTSLNWNSIGEKLGGKDRTTVMHGYEKIASDINEDENLKKQIEAIKKKINPS